MDAVCKSCGEYAAIFVQRDDGFAQFEILCETWIFTKTLSVLMTPPITTKS